MALLTIGATALVVAGLKEATLADAMGLIAAAEATIAAIVVKCRSGKPKRTRVDESL